MTSAGSGSPELIRIEVDSKDLPRFQIGDAVWLTSETNDAGMMSCVSGRIQRIEPTQVQGERRFVVHLSLAARSDQPAGGAGTNDAIRFEGRKTFLTTAEINLSIYENQSPDMPDRLVETWNRLTLEAGKSNSIDTRLNDRYAGSAFVCVALTPTAGHPVLIRRGKNPANAISPRSLPGMPSPALIVGGREALVGGGDGDNPTTADYKSALDAFDTVDMQLLSVILEDRAEDDVAAIHKDGIAYCERRGDCIYLGQIPRGLNVLAAQFFGQRLQSSKSYGVLYWPWIAVTDPTGKDSNPIRWIPPIGHVGGTYARIAGSRGIWEAPAGNKAGLRGALAVERDITDQEHTLLVREGSVNGIRRLPRLGIVIDASRTLSTDPRWWYVNVRLLFNYVKSSLRESLRWVKQEPNREALWRRITNNSIRPFLSRLYQEGAFGPGTPEQVFRVVCGPENNPPQEVTKGNLTVEVYFYPSRPAETIVIKVGQQDGASSAAER